MIKRKFKIAIAILAIFCIFFSSLSFATDTTLLLNNNESMDEEIYESEDIGSEITSNDLYLIDEKVVLNDLVDGNVYAIGNDITITGKINGNLYVLGNNIKIQNPSDNKECYITGSVYLCGNEIYFNAVCSDLYAVSKAFTGAYDSYIDRDLRLTCENASFYGLIARNAYISAEKISFISEETGDMALINGNLDYSCKTELSLDKSIVNGEIIFNPIIDHSSDINDEKTLKDYIYDIVVSLVSTIIIYLLILWLTPKFKETTKEYISIKLLPALGIGFASLVLIPIACIILLITVIGIPLSILLLLLYIALIMISFAIVAISASELIKGKLNSKNLGTDLLILACVNIVLYLLKQIPYVGGWISFIFLLMGMGIVVMYLFTKNKKKNTKPAGAIKNSEE